ncbi:MAG: RNB domain-containing ribonuclease [Deltaproteobacteria bacterium]|nr:RNB domain-containing ribonuclease [Deltaproteobacteria bacterium]
MSLFPTSSSHTNPDTSLSPGAIATYENNDVTITATIIGTSKKKLKVLNLNGGVTELAPARLHPLSGKIPNELESNSDKAKYLFELNAGASNLYQEIQLETIWETFEGSETEVEDLEICEMYFGDTKTEHHLAIRLKLAIDKIYFKRKKQAYISRTPAVVEELKRAREVELAKVGRRAEVLSACKDRITKKDTPWPKELRAEIALLEDLAAGSTEGNQTKEAKELVHLLCEGLGINEAGRVEERAYAILLKTNHFDEFTNLAIIKHRPRIEFPKDILDEASNLRSYETCSEILQHYSPEKRRDLTNLDCVTIDDATTQDMDDALSLEIIDDGYLLGIHITDVSALIPHGSLLDQEARLRSTSIYCPEQTINMLPEELSQNILSLKAGVPRPAVSYLYKLTRDFQILSKEIVLSCIQIKNRYDYNQVDQCLNNEGNAASMPMNERAKLNLLRQVATSFEFRRIDQGAVKISRKDVTVLRNEDGTLYLSEFDEASPSRSLVGELMILANNDTALFASENNLPLIYRSQPDPDEDYFHNPQNIPEGPAYDYLVRSKMKRSVVSTEANSHSTLGLKAYTQVTSPIRRYLDLVLQRQISTYLTTGEEKYSKDELQREIFETEVPLSNARAITFESKRFWMLKYLEKLKQEQQNLTGTVIRLDLKHPLVHFDKIYTTFPCMSKNRLSLGQEITAKILKADPKNDIIKLETI